MKRRKFVAVLGGTTAWPLGSEHQWMKLVIGGMLTGHVAKGYWNRSAISPRAKMGLDDGSRCGLSSFPHRQSGLGAAGLLRRWREHGGEVNWGVDCTGGRVFP